MGDRLISLYHGLPAPVRSLAATLRGFYLRRWRYGPESERLIAEALERDFWRPDQWQKWIDERLAFILHRAATKVPYYRELWARRRRAGDSSSFELLENWPILEKEELRRSPRAFIADDCNPRRMFHEQSSGTTGKPIHVWRSRRTVAELYAIADARSDRWHGIKPGTRWARLGGQLVTSVHQRHPPFWVWNAAMNQLYMSTFHLAPDLIPHYLDALRRYRIAYLAGYPSSLVPLAQQVLALGRDDLTMLAVIANAEPLHREQRDLLERAFHCPVLETYGMAETVVFGSECPARRLHQWPEVGVLEVWSDRGPAGSGVTGEFIGTGLLNRDMPLIRYRVGDRGRLAPPGSSCACGRTLPVIEAIEGRSTDLVLTRDGRSVFWLNPVFYGLPVRQSQIVQESLDRITVRVAPAQGFGEPTRRAIYDRMQARLGDMAIELHLMDEIPRTSNGKLQAIVSKLSPEERDAAIRGNQRRSPRSA